MVPVGCGAFNILSKSSVSLRLSVLSKVSLIWVWEMKMREKMAVEITAEESSRRRRRRRGIRRRSGLVAMVGVLDATSVELLQTAADLDCRLGATDSV